MMRYRIKVEYQLDDKVVNFFYTSPGETLENAIELVRQAIIKRMESKGGSIISISEDN